MPDDLRDRYDIPADIPIVPGPALADVRRQQSGGGMFAFAFEPQQITLNKDFAQRVMSMLYQQIEKQPHR